MFDGELIALGDRDASPVQDFASVGRAVFVVSTLPADPDTHERLVSIGFEGSVLKRQNSSYRAGRVRSWRKLKARHAIPATIRRLDRDREGRPFARCVLPDGRSCSAWVPATAEPTREQTTIVYSRVDANDSWREPRLAESRTRTVAA